MSPSDHIIVPLDVASGEAAVDLVGKLKGHVGAFKVGLELINSAGVGVFDMLRKAGAERIFYDCKLHDIPNTVAGATRAITGRGIWMFNVHASGGVRMMRAAVDAASSCPTDAGTRPIILAVTLLTSLTDIELFEELHAALPPVDYVGALARHAREAGCDGVVCSPHEIEVVRWACGPDFVVVTPGVRPEWSDTNDQRRIMTPAQAIAAGADYIVVGRPITASDDPAARARRIADELAGASA